MIDRGIEVIIAEWRAAERAIDPEEPDPELVERIVGLRRVLAAKAGRRRAAKDGRTARPAPETGIAASVLGDETGATGS